ncbi:MAG TPA: filamentous hemagglutinin N-terminal domain-containing protein [Rhodocyclaceae bacterium]|nr:filamentous hemagglutinin N-terminal domain-containing protein [Rhodocyclaceae bacterium]
MLNWKSFSIGLGETVRFVQPTAPSTVLNRVTGGDPSCVREFGIAVCMPQTHNGAVTASRAE